MGDVMDDGVGWIMGSATEMGLESELLVWLKNNTPVGDVIGTRVARENIIDWNGNGVQVEWK